ncbi:MAG TPA: isomerase, partial [Balneolaceae bacterium]|nr:isomerase [Balneolaceae bacterium]
VEKSGDRLVMNFPAVEPLQNEAPAILFQALGVERTSEVYKSDDYMVVLNSEQEVANLDPDFRMLNEVDA